MPSSKVAENVLGTIGWTGQLLPQIYKTWRTKSTHGLSHWLVLSWGVSGFFLAVYAIVQKLSTVLIVQPHLLAFFSLVSWGQCLYYEKKHTRVRAAVEAGGVWCLGGALEVGMVFAVMPSYEGGNDRPVQFFGIFSAVLIAFGLLPQYHEIYKLREVLGISLTFIAIDMSGGVFLDLSLAFSGGTFDVIPAVTYTIPVVMDALVLIAALVLNPRRRKEQERKRTGGGEAATVVRGGNGDDGEGTAETTVDGTEHTMKVLPPSSSA